MRLKDADALSEWLKDYGQKVIKGERKISLMYIWKHVQDMPTIEPERKKGKWTEKEVMSAEESKSIEQWQSCKCSKCGRYDTRPYLYYFDEPRFCSYCGAKMEDE